LAHAEKPPCPITGQQESRFIAIPGQKQDLRKMEDFKMCVGPLAPKMPKPPALPPPPPIVAAVTRDDPQVNADADSKRRRLLAAKGQSSTINSASLGDQTPANVGKSLLGSA